MKDKNNKVEISVIVITKNEEKKIEACLKSLSWVDEIAVIDNGSDDKTVKIAESFGAKIVIVSRASFSELRTGGLREVSGKWVLYIDADEKVTLELKGEILEILKKSKYDSYAIPRRNIILGREMRHGGWWPDYVKRLFKKEALKSWRGKLHEEPEFVGEMGHLKNPMIHNKHDNLSDMVKKTNEWSDIEAELLLESRHPSMNVLRFISVIVREFWVRMIKKAAFLDGSEGIIYALYQVWSRFITYTKLWELQIKRKKYPPKINTHLAKKYLNL